MILTCSCFLLKNTHTPTLRLNCGLVNSRWSLLSDFRLGQRWHVLDALASGHGRKPSLSVFALVRFGSSTSCPRSSPHRKRFQVVPFSICQPDTLCFHFPPETLLPTSLLHVWKVLPQAATGSDPLQTRLLVYCVTRLRPLYRAH